MDDEGVKEFCRRQGVSCWKLFIMDAIWHACNLVIICFNHRQVITGEHEGICFTMSRSILQLMLEFWLSDVHQSVCLSLIKFIFLTISNFHPFFLFTMPWLPKKGQNRKLQNFYFFRLFALVLTFLRQNLEIFKNSSDFDNFHIN